MNHSRSLSFLSGIPITWNFFHFLRARFRFFIREIRRETMPFFPQTSLLREIIGIGFVKVR